MKRILKNIVRVAVLVLLLSNPLKAEAKESEAPDVVSFPEYGITEIQIPEGMCVVTADGAFCDVPFPDERKAEYYHYMYAYDNVLLYLLSSNSAINYGVFFYEMDYPTFSEEEAFLSDADYQAKYADQPEFKQDIIIDRLYLDDTFCKEFTYYDTDSCGYRDVYYIYTKAGDKYYEIEIRLFSYLEMYSEDEARLLRDLVANATFDEATMKEYTFDRVPETIDFPEYGITEIKIPEGMCVVTADGAFCDVPFPDERKAEYYHYMYAYDNVLLYLLLPDSDVSFGVFFYEPDHPEYIEEYTALSEEDFQSQFSNPPEYKHHYKVDRQILGDNTFEVFSYYDTDASAYRYVLDIFTKADDKHYEIMFQLYSSLEYYSEEEEQLLRDLAANSTFNISSIKDSPIYPVPTTVDFPEYGIYNVTVPEGFSLFTADEMFIDPKFYSMHYVDIENIVNSFTDNPARVARIINSDYTYEIDLKAYEDTTNAEVFLHYGIPDFIFKKIYPFYYDNTFQISNIRRGDIYGKYGIEANSYDTERDFCFHLLDYMIVYDGKIHDIDYHLNSYGGPIDYKMDNLFIGTAKDLTFDEVYAPKQKKDPKDSKGIIYYIEKIARAIKDLIIR